MRSSRLCAAPVVVPMVLWSLPLLCSVSQESCFSLQRHYLRNKYTLYMTFGYLRPHLVCMCGPIDPGHTCDEYSVLA
jgi:hypothetical protein